MLRGHKMQVSVRVFEERTFVLPALRNRSIYLGATLPAPKYCAIR